MIAREAADSTTVPTLIAYFGSAPAYLEVALRSAADFNGHVVLLGDEKNRGAWTNHWDSSRVGVSKFDEFSRSYVKMSDYPEAYESAFWRRPFVVEEWMRREGVDRAFLLDSDTVTFADYAQEVLPTLPSGTTAGVSTLHEQEPFDWMSSLHFSYWTREALADFTSFCIHAYRDPDLRQRLEAKYRWHVENRQPGGICEMTLLYLWRERHEKTIWNPAQAWNGAVADWAVTTADNYLKGEYVTRLGFKKLVFRNGIPYGITRRGGGAVRFLSVHCQGAAKQLMRHLYMPGWQRFYADAYRLRRLAGRARIRSSARAVLAALRSVGRRRSA